MDGKIIWSIAFMMIVIIFCIIKPYTRRIFLFRFNYWNYHRYKDNTDILWNAKGNWKNYQIIVDRVINQYFRKPNYFKINGEPVFSIFSVPKSLTTV